MPRRATRVLLGEESPRVNLNRARGSFEWAVIRSKTVMALMQRFWKEEQGQDIAEYAVMLAVILVIVIGTVRLIGGSANNVFSQVGSAIAQ